MNIKRILAAASVSVVAVSAMAVVASAAEAFKGERAYEYIDAWDQNPIVNKDGDFSKLLGDVKPEDVDTIVFTATDDMSWVMCFDGTDKVPGVDKAGWTQTDSIALPGMEAAGFINGGSITIKGEWINWEKADLFVAPGVNAADGGKLTWVVNTKESGTSSDNKDDNKGDNSNVDTGVEGVAAVLGVAALAAGAMIVSKKRK